VERIRYFLDEHVAEPVAVGLRGRGLDVLTVRESGRKGQSDDLQLAFAHDAGRMIVTQDADYLALANEGRLHAGIAFIPSGRIPIGSLIRALATLHQEQSADQVRGMVIYLKY